MRKGRMTKSPFKTTFEEEKAWRIEKQRKARVFLFSIGQPLVYKKDGVMIAEYADGRKVHVH